ncbi:MAG: hypothetical protein MZU97_07175 [Bacillus subtilis]|nr:hypothetical protein [Bacillus subtilis]
MTDLLFKPFENMTMADYAAVGFRSGLEIHQQLLTSRKLFCRCPAARYSDHYHAEILRHMRPTLSELGVYDGTALMEFKTKKEIIYRIHRETVCTYEMDDTPPFEINDEALDIALGIGMLFQMRRGGRASYRAETVPRREHPDGIPADGDLRAERTDSLQGSGCGGGANVDRRGFLPRGE